MGYNIEYKEEDNMLYFNLSGEVEEYMFSQLTESVLDIIQRSEAEKVLVNIQNLYGRLSLSEIVLHVDDYPGFLLKRKIAVIEREENKAYYTFHQTVANNRGFRIGFFTDIDSALHWLLEQNLHLHYSIS